jgi:TolB-like protein
MMRAAFWVFCSGSSPVESSALSNTPNFLKQLWKRRVVQFGGLYLGAAWVLLQLAMAIEETMNLPDWVDQTALVLLVIGFPLVLILAWAQEAQSGDAERPVQNRTESPSGASVSGKPSIAILPFVNMSDDSEKDYLADGMTEDIITGLSLSRHLSVKSRSSTAGYKGQLPDVRQLGNDLGVTYIVEGSIRPIGDRVRISVQLITAESGDNLWTEKYDRPAEQLFDIQDAVIASITSALGANITKAESSRAASSKPTTLSAWEAVQRASFYRGADGNSEEETNKSIEELRAAARDEPSYAYAHSMLAWILHYRVINGLTDDPKEDVLEAGDHLQKGLALAADDPFNLNICAGALGYVGQWDRAEELCRRALSIDPNFADVYFNLGNIYTFSGRFEEAEKALDRVEEMAPGGRSTIDKSPSYTSPYIHLALTLAEQGKRSEATQTLVRALGINPRLTVERLTIIASAHSDPDQRQRRLQMLKELWPEEGADRSGIG